MNSLGERLKNHWISIGTKVRSGASEQTIRSFEATYGVYLPQDLNDYYRIVDGMEEGETDNDLFEFLPLHSVKSVAEDLVEFSGIPDYRNLKDRLPNLNYCFVFIDYMIRSHVYAFYLSQDSLGATPIIWICGPNWQIIAPSFSDFGERYLIDRNEILFPKNMKV